MFIGNYHRIAVFFIAKEFENESSTKNSFIGRLAL